MPKAHLHLHFTGSMSIASLRHLAELAGKPLPDFLIDENGLLVPFNERGWFRFQRLYDMARSVVNSEAAMRFIVAQAARDDAAEGSRRLELQVDPSSYAPFVGGLAPAIEIILDEAARASAETGVQVAIIVAASRVRHPLDARTIARLAARHAGENGVVAFGLSNNERSGTTADWEPAFRIARQAGLPGVPHGGELLGPVGDNFAAGMSGGMAYVWDPADKLGERLNGEMVISQRLEVDHYVDELKGLLAEHLRNTQSPLAERLLREFDLELPSFWQVVPKEMLDKLPIPVRAEEGAAKRA